MRQHTVKLALFLLGGAVVLGLLALAWALGSGSSQAQDGTMHNCPQAGKWAISVWDGQDGTDTGQALATCTGAAVVAAYYIDPETQMWSHYFPGSAINTLLNLNDKQGVIALGGAEAPATPVPGMPNPASVYCVELGYELRIVDTDGEVGICIFPDGTQCEEWSFFEGKCGQIWAVEPSSSQSQDAMHNCPQPGRWAISVWDGPDDTDTGQALAKCGPGAVDFAYYLDPATNNWLAYFEGQPLISNLLTLDNMQGVIAHGASVVATPTPTAMPATATPMPSPTVTPMETATPTATATATPTPEIAAPIPGATYHGTTSQGKPVEFRITADGAGIDHYDVKADMSCTGGSLLGYTYWRGQTDNIGPIVSIVDNAFAIPLVRLSYSFPSDGEVEGSFSGRFTSSSTAAGELRVETEPDECPTCQCDSGPVTWTASSP